jgi:hypothetical protein
MNSPANSTCATVSNRPAELKPITASLCSSFRLASCSTNQGIVEHGCSLFEGDAVLALILRGFRLVPAEARAAVFKDAVHAYEFSSLYLQYKYRLTSARAGYQARWKRDWGA